MQQFSDKIVGHEILTFEGAELFITQDKSITALSKDTLSVFYFDEISTFCLMMKGWDYALLKTLTIACLGEKYGSDTMSFKLPDLSGYYTLKLTQSSREALKNFETILKNSTMFSQENEPLSEKEINFIISSTKTEETEATKEKGLLAKGLKSIRERVSKVFKKGQNPNMSQFRDIESLKNINEENNLTSYEFSRDEINNVIERIEKINFSTRVNEKPLHAKNNKKKGEQSIPRSKGRVKGSTEKIPHITHKTLLSPLENHLNALKRQEQQREEEYVEIKKRDRELLEENEAKTSELDELEKRYHELTDMLQYKELEINGKEKELIDLQEEIKQKEKEFKYNLQREQNEITKKERQNEEGLKGFRKMEKDFLELEKKLEKEKLEFLKKKETFEDDVEKKWFHIRTVQYENELLQDQLERKGKDLIIQAELHLEDLRKKEHLAGEGIREIQTHEEAVLNMAALKDKQERKLQEREAEFRRRIEQKEAEVREKERLTESERKELFMIRERLQQEADLTIAQKEVLHHKRIRLLEEVQKREHQLLERQKLTETEWLKLEKQERESQQYLEKRLAELREKERLTEEERMDYEKKEEELTRILKITEIESRRGEVRLVRIKDYENKLLMQNEEVVKRHLEFQEELEEVARELRSSTERLERRNRKVTRETERGNGKETLEAYETITTG